MTSTAWLGAAVIAAALAPDVACAATTADNFTLATTGDLVALCTAEQTDPQYQAAIHFCQGFAVGVYTTEREHEAGSRMRPLFCVGDTPPPRNEALAAFIAWANADPSRLSTKPVDGVIGFLIAQFPCAKPSAKSAKPKGTP